MELKINNIDVVRLTLTALVCMLLTGQANAQTSKPVPALGVCASLDKAPLLKKYGYDFIQPTVDEVLKPLKTNYPRKKAKKAEVSIAVCNVFIPGSIKTVGQDVDEIRVVNYAETVFKRAKALKIPLIVFGSGASRMIPEGFSRDSAFQQFISIGKKLAPLAARYGIVLALESQNKEECNFLNTVKECIEVARAVNHPNYRICIDTYHMMREDEPPSIILEAGDLAYHCDIGEEIDRAAPGVTGVDFVPYFKAFQKIKYKGKISLECRFKDMDKELPLAKKTIETQWQEALTRP